MNKIYENKIKRMIDFALSLIGVVILFPVFLIISLLIKLETPGSIFFRQRRIGKGKLTFLIYKFRSMRMDTPENVPTHQLVSSDTYLTKIGSFLRKTSLDELPQLFNILKGEMSFIGPRPALWNQEDLIAKRDQYGVNEIRPGLTGLAQVSGRDELEIEEKARLDGEYVKCISFWLDCKIFMKTIFSVFKHDGVVEGGTSVLRERGKEK
jgi:O-antigen biosynthesis protein WbqP